MKREQDASSTRGKQDHIVGTLRRKMIEGEYAPGARLPTQVELIERFGVSGVTIQRAIHQLVAAGYLETQGRRGTFVARHPPHMYRYGLVIPPFGLVIGVKHSRFYDGLREAAAAITHDPADSREVIVYDGAMEAQGNPPFAKLMSDVDQHRLTGVVVTLPYVYGGSRLMRAPHLRRVAIAEVSQHIDMPRVFPDLDKVIEDAVGYLASKGVTKPAVIVSKQMYNPTLTALRTQMKRRGMKLADHAIQIVPIDVPEAARNATMLLMHASRSDRPKGLFILDDNLIEAVCDGLVEAEARVPDDLHVVSLCTFPVHSEIALPLTLIGFDARVVLERAMEQIDRMREGDPVEPALAIAPHFEATQADTF